MIFFASLTLCAKNRLAGQTYEQQPQPMHEGAPYRFASA